MAKGNDLILNISDETRIHLKNFGPHCCGKDGKTSFRIIVKDAKGLDIAVIENVQLADLFTRLSLNGNDFIKGVYHQTDYFSYDPKTKKITGKTELGQSLSLKIKYL